MDLSLFHFLRPEWLLIIPAWLLISWLLVRTGAPQRLWENICDSRLIPFVVTHADRQHHRYWLLTLLSLWGIVISLALAGPTWKQKPVPVWQPQLPLVVLFDVSQSMDATDLKPNRLKRARYKLQDLFRARQGSPVALVAFSSHPFVLVPLSNDSDTLNHLAGSLATDLVPVQGSRIDRALEKAGEMIHNTGFPKGDVLLITDEQRSSQQAIKAASSLADEGIHLSVLAVGSKSGAPIPSANGFVRDTSGNMVLTHPNEDFLKELARLGKGRYAQLSSDDSDIQSLIAGFYRPDMNTTAKSEQHITQWYEYGPWLIPPLLLLTALGFRRGLLFMLPLLVLPIPRANAFEWNDLWKSPDQQGYQAFEQGQYGQASEHFHDSRWRSSALYKAGDYNEALKAQGTPETADDWYNRGNMLARSGNIAKALEAYNKALELNPEHEDARYNKSLLEKQQQQQNQKPNQNQGQGKNQDKNQQGKDQKQGSQGNQSQNKDNKSQESKQENKQKNTASQNQANNKDKSGDNASNTDKKNNESGQSEQADQQKKQNQADRQDQSQTDQQQMPPEENKQKPRDSSPGDKGEQTQDNALASQDDKMRQQAADEAWLRQIPNDPASLMQRMFQYEALKHHYRSEKETW
jgi:Ca-activated chloride channel homolog